MREVYVLIADRCRLLAQNGLFAVVRNLNEHASVLSFLVKGPDKMPFSHFEIYICIEDYIYIR